MLIAVALILVVGKLIVFTSCCSRLDVGKRSTRCDVRKMTPEIILIKVNAR